MAEQHAQAWIVERMYDVVNVRVYKRGLPYIVGKLSARDSNMSSYAWSMLRYLTGRRSKEPQPPARYKRQAERVRANLERELAR